MGRTCIGQTHERAGTTDRVAWADDRWLSGATTGMIGGMDQPSVSVVIPTHGRPELLRRCLSALVEQAYPAERTEIIVVEDGGPGAAELVVRELEHRSPRPVIRYLTVKQGGPGAARNAGLQVASGD